MEYIIRMAAGLANRMLQYSYYLYLQKKGYNVLVDNSYKATVWKMEDIDWERIFPKAKIDQAPKWKCNILGGGNNLISKVARHYLPFLTKTCIMKDSFSIPTEEELNRFRYFIGIFQDCRIMDDIESEIQNAFTFSPFETNSQNDVLAKKMAKENSVAIHVRKGKDYLTRVEFKGTCPVDYYENAVKYLKEKVNNPVFYVFTDNPEWVKNNLNSFEYELIDWNSPVGWGNHYDMQLMSCCHHNIISNSTYSWWGAYLNKNTDKIVVGPNFWFNKDLKKYKDINNIFLCPNWTRL